MEATQLNYEDLILFSSIHNKILSKRLRNFEKRGISSNNLKMKYIVEPVIKKSKQILDMFNKTNYNLSKTYIEFQQRNCGFGDNNARTFDWHKDDYGVSDYKVFTIIFYLRKDIGIKGGDLEYKLNNTNYIQDIKTGTVLCFDGDLQHRPEICSGFGCRDTIVVFVKKLSS